MVAGVPVGLERSRFLPGWSTMYSDASGSWGCGAFILGSAEWLQLPWPASWIEVPIAAKEAVPIVASLAVWGNRWVGGTVQVFCDNMAVVQCLRTGSAKDPASTTSSVCWPCSSPGSRCLSVPNTLPACGTVRRTRCREIMLHYFSHSFPRPPGVLRWFQTASRPSCSTWRAPGCPKSGWRG